MSLISAVFKYFSALFYLQDLTDFNITEETKKCKYKCFNILDRSLFIYDSDSRKNGWIWTQIDSRSFKHVNSLQCWSKEMQL